MGEEKVQFSTVTFYETFLYSNHLFKQSVSITKLAFSYDVTPLLTILKENN